MYPKKKLPVGIESFSEIRQDNFYYVDKTKLIEELLDNWGKANLFTRPRRFGKSLNMSMLKSFFETGTDKNLFEGLYISQNKNLCAAYLGKFPVVFISLKGVQAADFDRAKAMLVKVVNEEARRLQFLLQSEVLTDIDKELFRPLLKKEMDDCEQAVNEIKAKRTSCYSAIDEIQQKLRRASVKENTAKMNVEQVQNRQREAKLRCEGYLKEQEGLELRLREILDNEDSIQMELETSEALEKELNNRIGELQESLESDKEKETVQLRHSEEVHLAYASLEQQNAFILENITRIQEETEKFEIELKELDINKGNASEEIQEKEDKIQDLRETIENSKELFEEINTEIKSQVAKREELNQKHKAFLGKREELSRHMSELDKECFRLSSRRESYEEASEKQINYMWDEYELTYNHAMELRNENLTDLSI